MEKEQTERTNKPRAIQKELIVVSGASGLIGTALIEKLASRFLIAGLDNAGYPFPPAEAECICVDLTSDQSVEFAFERIRYAYGNQIASVVHLAAYYDFLGKPSDLYDKVTVKGTERLLKNLQKFKVDQFLFSSSMLVYKPSSPGVKMDEEWPLKPKWDYPKSKVATEKVLNEKRGKIPVVIMRIAGVYDEQGNSIPITNQIQRIYEEQISARLYPGDISHGSTYVHLDDLVDSIVKVIDKRKELPPKVILNIGDNETLAYQELQDIITKAINGKKSDIIRIPKWFAKTGAFMLNLFGKAFIKPWMIDLADDHFELDSTKAKQVIDWRPKHALSDTLPEIVKNLKANPEKFYKVNKLKK
ncbi:NAD(P)-dependent oxidoreductase [Mucilaginibacter rubeus]|uniref:NAD(P)-dependent oxidoreductase n=1 Tax=Mucilaginibacter rubeus TaxID=2027860 RepID=A0AAE6JKL1_9SPHI|nr:MULTISPECIES: NAD(P)-dependent oxidoreductase [Mucilaginibacter]NHA05630.1 NAD(P)-dependent oxidoreductase [Mucilaginibacter inviolabilis]QEM07051.1 NAD(P)-dependent oxidoreductase [Mucilaginibacter rubeus]QTE35434.1 NAD(P)-dependent oxidoreductase [Mucilaginibacter gossypii]QTE43806.1 NAD(P)-dependent oxidoreductase [Mucilaginibacter rubeus]QTE50405.1 NAD(P)-dependent oxidoreductase [Mucilaginibacter rubeus]